MVDPKQGLDWYRQLLTIRRFEEKCAEGYAYAKIGGFLHLYIGQEAVAVGGINALRPDDDIVTHYRDHGHAIARGLGLDALMAELYGKATGVCGGRGGSMHFADVNRHFWGGYAIVGGHLPLAVGLALASKYEGRDRVALGILGDGANNNGGFHESINMGAVFQLPMIFLIENNLYSMGVAQARDSAIADLYRRAEAYGIPGEAFDGMDVLAAHEAMTRAAAHARAGKGPYLLEAKTYRFRGHSMADPEMYRPREEVEAWRQRDPLITWRRRGLEEGWGTEAEFQALEREVDLALEAAVRFAEESPEPALDTLCDHIYAAPPAGFSCHPDMSGVTRGR